MPKQRSNRKAKKSVNYGAMAPIFVAVLVVLAVGIFILYDVSGASGKLNGNMALIYPVDASWISPWGVSSYGALGWSNCADMVGGLAAANAFCAFEISASAMSRETSAPRCM